MNLVCTTGFRIASNNLVGDKKQIGFLILLGQGVPEKPLPYIIIVVTKLFFISCSKKYHHVRPFCNFSNKVSFHIILILQVLGLYERESHFDFDSDGYFRRKVLIKRTFDIHMTS